MKTRIRASAVAAVLAMAAMMWCSPLAEAQKKQAVPAAPIPAQILTAQKVFIANAGGDESPYEGPWYSGNADRFYNEFYAAMKSWGHYDLVATPADADLVFEVQEVMNQEQNAGGWREYTSYVYDTQFRLAIRDARTRQVLWGLTEHAQAAVLQGNRDRNFESALDGIVAEVKRIAAPPASDAANASKSGGE
ncbi:MAG TPA: hypothetical protein VJR23_08390 [Candidatus Acidoferrales bacterium]|nr:hypothetical protein [Candidatus Acidoferrales bacterium]